MPRTPRQYDEIREEKRKLILSTAIDLFASKGYKSTSIEQIARQAGISKGLMYNYFPSKENLLKTIYHNIVSEMAGRLDLNGDGILEPHELAAYVEKTFDQVRQNVKFWRLYSAIAFQPEVAEMLAGESLSIAENMEYLLLEYFHRQGYKNPGAEVAVLAAMMGGAIMKYLGAPEHFPIDEVKNRIIELYVKQKK